MFVGKEVNPVDMSSSQMVLVKVFVLLGMSAVVVTVLYFSPLPAEYFESCDRPCHELDWPMICRVKLMIDLQEDGTLTFNNQSPGPPIQVCQNDILVVDVTNKVPGQSLTIHWRGQWQAESPYMDGVPLITQCPIPSYTTFQYKFRASKAGTHLYHAYADQSPAGLYGALIVKRPLKIEPHRKVYDVDLEQHIILISHRDHSLRINGDDSYVFNVEPRKRYRFRTIHAGNCPVNVTVENHPVTVIALDGNPVNPIQANAFVLSKGERLDFVVKTKQTASGVFPIKITSNCAAAATGLLNYPQEGTKAVIEATPGRVFTTASCTSEIGTVCLDDIKSVKEINENLQTSKTDKIFYLGFGPMQVQGKNSARLYGINNLTFTFPSAPLLTQLKEVSLSYVCDEFHLPKYCKKDGVCECVHVEFIPLGSTTEIILINQDKNSEEHVFHLHGNHFRIVGSRHFPETPQVSEIKRLDSKGELFQRNFNSPAIKDTLRISKGHVVAVRFIARNPGFWILRDENSKSWTRGMDIVFQVGDSGDMLSAPANFPTCGNYIGPDFFLM